jgi:hypothetical protein
VTFICASFLDRSKFQGLTSQRTRGETDVEQRVFATPCDQRVSDTTNVPLGVIML